MIAGPMKELMPSAATRDVGFGVAGSAAGLTLLWLLSPVTGLAVEMALAWKLGTSGIVDAYRIASILTAFGWQFFVVDILPALVVPLLARSTDIRRQRAAWTVAFSLGNVLLIPTTLVCILTFAWPEPATALLAPGFIASRRAAASLFVQWFSLTFVPLVWAGVGTGILYAQGVFWVPVAASTAGNVIILAVLLSANRDSACPALITGTLIASCVTLGLLLVTLVPLMRRARVSARVLLSFELGNASVREAIAMALPLTVLVFAGQAASITINRVLCRELSGTVATFGYAWKMLQLVTIAPTALATVLFPKFAETWQLSSSDGFSQTCTRGVRMGLYLAFPLTMACFVLRLPLTILLFHRGAYSLEAAAATAHLFGLLLLAAPASVLSAYLQRISYALQNTLMPSLIQSAGYALVSVFAPLVGSWFGADGLCVLIMATQWLACGLVSHSLSKGYDALDLPGMLRFGSKLLPLGLVSAWIGAGATPRLLVMSQASDVLTLIFRIVATSGVIVAFFIALTLVFRFPEALAWPRYLRLSASAVVRSAFSGNR